MTYYEEHRDKMLMQSTRWYHEKNTREKKEQKIKLVIAQQRFFLDIMKISTKKL